MMHDDQLNVTPVEFSGISGGSFDADNPSDNEPATSSSTPQLLYCKEPGCRKSYKTAQGYNKHMTFHKISNVNARKPSIEDVAAAMNEVLESVLDGILAEPSYGKDGLLKKNFVENLKERILSPNWHHFVSSLANPILESLLKQTKLMPMNVYEEALKNFNEYLNEGDTFKSLMRQLKFVTADVCDIPDSVARRVLFRISQKLMEKMQVYIASSMRTPSSSAVACPGADPDIPEREREAFCSTIGEVLRSAYKHFLKCTGELREAICDCIRKSFIVSDHNLCHNAVLDESLWKKPTGVDDGSEIRLSETVVKFFWKAELLLRSLELLSADKVIKLLEENAEALDLWFQLTNFYLNEADALDLMRDIVTRFIRKVSRLHCKQILSKNKDAVKTTVALRTAFKK